MARYDASTAEVLVFTFKEGLLSAAAHDLKLSVGRFTIDVEGDRVTAEFDAGSLKVVTPMKDGAENPGAMPHLMYGEIEKNAAKDVLHAAKHPSIRFESTSVTAEEVVGRLTLHGQAKEVRGRRLDAGGKRVVEVSLDQRDFGIKPYSAMLGTLKVKPVVRVRVTVPSA
jgi:polyisoprenoid-binding protein YceI